MSEYSYNDIIMDPEDPRLEGAIGKECYFSDCPTKLLESARYNSALYLDCLTNISKEKACPFVDKNGSVWTLIIIKKEQPKPKYVPFESKKEFIEAFHYHDKTNCSETEDILMNYGMWLKDKNGHEIFLVTGVFNQSIHICDFDSDESWGELLNEFTFLDGSPCGKLAEENKNGNSFDR